MKFKHKRARHINRKADGKFRGVYLCSDCIKNVKRPKGTKHNTCKGIWSEKYVFNLGGLRVYTDTYVPLTK